MVYVSDPYQFDTLNRLIPSHGPQGSAGYNYDNAGNRYYKDNDSGDHTLYLRHGQIAVAMDLEWDSTSSKVNRYVLSGDLIAGRITMENGEVTRSYYHLDHLNSTKWVTNEDSLVEVRYEYRAFGEQLKRLDGNGDEVEDIATYSYSGKELDGENDLYYFNARYYDATLGRFINVDPIQDGLNWYLYCSNNPINYVDPTGLSDDPSLLRGLSFASKLMYIMGEALSGDSSGAARSSENETPSQLGTIYRSSSWLGHEAESRIHLFSEGNLFVEGRSWEHQGEIGLKSEFASTDGSTLLGFDLNLSGVEGKLYGGLGIKNNATEGMAQIGYSNLSGSITATLTIMDIELSISGTGDFGALKAGADYDLMVADGSVGVGAEIGALFGVGFDSSIDFSNLLERRELNNEE